MRGDSDDIEQVVVRIATIDKPSRRINMHKEHVVLRHLDQIGFGHAPKSYLYDATLKYVPVPYAVQEFVPTASAAAGDDFIVADVAMVMARLHAVSGAELFDQKLSSCDNWYELVSREMRHLRNWLLRVLDEIPPSEANRTIASLLDEAWQRVEATTQAQRMPLEQARATPCLTHGDLGTHNIGWTPTGPYLFDWEIATIGDPAFDIAKLFRNDLRHEVQQNQFLASYVRWHCESEQDFFVERIRIYEQLAALQSVVWSIGELWNNSDIGNSDSLWKLLCRNLQYINPSLAGVANESVRSVLPAVAGSSC